MSDFKRKVFEKLKGRCAYCGNDITIDNMTVDHKKPKSKGGSLSFSNCVPSCKRCNELKADGNIEDMKKKIEKTIKSLSKNKDFQILKKYGFVKLKKEPIIFYFEACEGNKI